MRGGDIFIRNSVKIGYNLLNHNRTRDISFLAGKKEVDSRFVEPSLSTRRLIVTCKFEELSGE